MSAVSETVRRGVRPRRMVGAVTIVACVLATSVGVASATARYPVYYTLTRILANADPDVAPAGANDWACRPSASHPQPVILVHGLFGNQHDTWYTLAPLLANNGYCVFTLNYGGSLLRFGPAFGVGPIEASAAQLSVFVESVLAATGAAKVDLVGHSLGATMPNYYIKNLGGDAKVNDFVGLAPADDGTTLDGIDTLASQFGIDKLEGVVCPACAQLVQGSPFLVNLNAGGITRPGVRYTTIVTRYDKAVTPYTSGLLTAAANVTNEVLQKVCPLDFAEHIGLAYDPNSLRLVLNALDPAHARSSCQFVPTVF